MNTTNGRSSRGCLGLLWAFRFGISEGSLAGIAGQTGE
jgi:hypothetical protein